MIPMYKNLEDYTQYVGLLICSVSLTPPNNPVLQEKACVAL
jgi:hypothetical protein